MQRLTGFLVGGFAAFGAGLLQSPSQYVLWQADLQIQSLTVSEAKGNLTVKIVVGSAFGEAIGARLEIMLPVGVGIVAMGAGCTAGPSVSGISELRARVECTLGNLQAHSNRTFTVVTTVPPAGVARGFGVIAMSDTPDPNPGNNFRERVIPLP